MVEARQEGYDIIFIDITMPILDGFGATRQIRAIEEKRKWSAMESMGLLLDAPVLKIKRCG
jgi:CheY-like chemotaxis protein